MSKLFLKVTVLGDRGVGKSTFVNQAVLGTCTQTYHPTFSSRTLNYDVSVTTGSYKRLVTIQLWDTPGSRVHSDHKKCCQDSDSYKQLDAAIIMFDARKNRSFDSVKWWMNRIFPYFISKSNDPYPFVVFLIGNEFEGEKENESESVSWSNVIDWANSIPHLHIVPKLISTYNRQHVQEIMELVAEQFSEEQTLRLVPNSQNTNQLDPPVKSDEDDVELWSDADLSDLDDETKNVEISNILMLSNLTLRVPQKKKCKIYKPKSTSPGPILGPTNSKYYAVPRQNGSISVDLTIQAPILVRSLTVD